MKKNLRNLPRIVRRGQIYSIVLSFGLLLWAPGTFSQLALKQVETSEEHITRWKLTLFHPVFLVYFAFLSVPDIERFQDVYTPIESDDAHSYGLACIVAVLLAVGFIVFLDSMTLQKELNTLRANLHDTVMCLFFNWEQDVTSSADTSDKLWNSYDAVEYWVNKS